MQSTSLVRLEPTNTIDLFVVHPVSAFLLGKVYEWTLLDLASPDCMVDTRTCSGNESVLDRLHKVRLPVALFADDGLIDAVCPRNVTADDELV